MGLGIRAALTAGVGAVVVDKEAAAAKVLLHAPHRALEHLSDLAGLEMAERGTRVQGRPVGLYVITFRREKAG
jgi:hypothetical protein